MSNTISQGAMSHFRIVCTVYWNGGPPSTEVFFVPSHAVQRPLTYLPDIEDIQARVLGLMRLNASTDVVPTSAILVSGDEEYSLTAQEITDLGWRIMTPVAHGGIGADIG